MKKNITSIQSVYEANKSVIAKKRSFNNLLDKLYIHNKLIEKLLLATRVANAV